MLPSSAPMIYICNDAINKYGNDPQMDMAIEEMSELTKAICKFKRNPSDPKNKMNIAEEIADVHIMLRQLELMLSIGRDVDCYEDAKLSRLRKKIRDDNL